MPDRFVTAHRWELDWQEDLDVLTLGNGVQVKVFRHEPERGRLDLLVKFPAGYVEPAHAHDSEHAIVVLEGVQIVDGVHLHPGDYCYGGREVIHGPFEYPEGCIVFASFTGASSQHRYPGSPGGEIGHG
jgi:anti-sigma factor ChrR (cupin superfamily)